MERRAPGTSKALLAYLPFTKDPETEEEIYYGLDALAKDRSERQELRKALRNRGSARRAVSACILGRIGSDDDKARVRKLLQDPSPLVRLRSAQGLLAGKDGEKKIITTLIELLKTPALEIVWQAEELLHYVAGASAPRITVRADGEREPKEWAGEWSRWWKSREATFDWKRQRMEERRPGLFLLCARDTLYLYGCSGKRRWVRDTAAELVDAQLLPGDRLLLLVTDFTSVVLEQTLTGKTIWSKSAGGETVHSIRSCRAWGDGRIFVAGEDGWIEWDHDRQTRGPLVQEGIDWTRSSAACKLANGMVVATQTYEPPKLHLFDPEKQQRIRSVQLPESMQGSKKLTIVPMRNGHLLLCDDDSRLCEMSSTGRVVWELRYPRSISKCLPLEDGRIVLLLGDRVGRLLEITRQGKGIWEAIFEEEEGTRRVTNVKRCLPLVSFGFPGRKEPAEDVDGPERQLDLLRDPSPRVREKALWQLGELRPKTTKAIKLLIAALGDKDEKLQSLAERALIAIGSESMPLLLDGLKQKDPLIVAGCVWVIGQLGNQAERVLPALMVAARSPHAQVRLTSMSVLGGTGPKAAIAIPAVVSGVKDENERVRLYAIDALGKIQVERTDVTNALVDCLADEDESVQRSAARALKEIGNRHRSLFKAIANQSKTADKLEVRRQCLLILRDVGPRAKHVLPDLLRMLREIKTVAKSQEIDEVRSAVIEAMGGVAPAHKDAALELVTTLVKPVSSHSLRLWALVTLEENRLAALLLREFLKGLTLATKGSGKPIFVRSLHSWASGNLERQIKDGRLIHAALTSASSNPVIKRDTAIHERVVRLIEETK